MQSGGCSPVFDFVGWSFAPPLLCFALPCLAFVLARLDPDVCFLAVSLSGTDSSNFSIFTTASPLFKPPVCVLPLGFEAFERSKSPGQAGAPGGFHVH